MDAEGEGVIDGQQLAARLEELPFDVMEALKPAVETFRGDASGLSRNLGPIMRVRHS